QRRRADRTGMRLDGDPREGLRQLRDVRKVLDWHRSPIEEVARVIELQPIRRLTSERVQNAFQLIDQRSTRRWAVDRPTPQIAERAREWTFGAGEENGEGPLDRPIRPALLLEQRAVHGVRIDVRLRRAEATNPSIDA